MPTPLASEPNPTSRYYVSQRLRLHYVDWGNEAAPPLILLHGGRDHCRSWDWVARRLCDRWHIIAPDLRGHGDSAWSTGNTYMIAGHLYDLAQLIHQQKLAPVTILAHSLGGAITLRYAGLYPENVKRIIAVEGLGQAFLSERNRRPVADRTREWIEETRKLAGHQPHRYASLEEAVRRMQDANKHLSPEQARHLTVHGVTQNEDGTYSWKFDPYVRPWPPYDMLTPEVQELWTRITCPTLMIWGSESWHPDPEKDGRAKFFRNVEVAGFKGAGHWVHHDQFEGFMARVEQFLAKPN